jgi:hypothetical protein
VVAETCHGPLITINATIAAVVRSIGADPPTLLVDEADTLWGTRKQADANEDLRGLLNAGHQRNRPMLRWDVTSRTAEQLDTFAMALLAAIGELPDTIMDRAVVVRMRRRAPGEQVDPYRTRRDAPPLHDLRESLSGWARHHLHELISAGRRERVRIIKTNIPASVRTVARGLTAPPIDGTLHPSTPGRAVASRELPGPAQPPQGQAPSGSPPASLDPPGPGRVRRYRPPPVGGVNPPDDRQPQEGTP